MRTIHLKKRRNPLILRLSSRSTPFPPTKAGKDNFGEYVIIFISCQPFFPALLFCLPGGACLAATRAASPVECRVPRKERECRPLQCTEAAEEEEEQKTQNRERAYTLNLQSKQHTRPSIARGEGSRGMVKKKRRHVSPFYASLMTSPPPGVLFPALLLFCDRRSPCRRGSTLGEGEGRQCRARIRGVVLVRFVCIYPHTHAQSGREFPNP